MDLWGQGGHSSAPFLQEFLARTKTSEILGFVLIRNILSIINFS